MGCGQGGCGRREGGVRILARKRERIRSQILIVSTLMNFSVHFTPGTRRGREMRGEGMSESWRKIELCPENDFTVLIGIHISFWSVGKLEL